VAPALTGATRCRLSLTRVGNLSEMAAPLMRVSDRHMHRSQRAALAARQIMVFWVIFVV
jgi:hypothetical protein